MAKRPPATDRGLRPWLPASGIEMPFELQFSPKARDHLKAFRKRDRQIILDGIEAQLRDQPDRATRNRKQLEENPLAPWELRVGDFRVFYDVNAEEKRVAA